MIAIDDTLKRLQENRACHRGPITAGVFILIDGDCVSFIGTGSNIHHKIVELTNSGAAFDRYDFIPCDVHDATVLQQVLCAVLQPRDNSLESKQPIDSKAYYRRAVTALTPLGLYWLLGCRGALANDFSITTYTAGELASMELSELPRSELEPTDEPDRDELDGFKVLKQWGDWYLTTDGIVHPNHTYWIEADRVHEPDWERHMMTKAWVREDPAPFFAALCFARAYFDRHGQADAITCY